jgi:Na+-transporting NADH:ubiquinone oxidoreductase subunit NqrA
LDGSCAAFQPVQCQSFLFQLVDGKKEYTLDARIKGGERHMIMSGEYDRVFPMDILPEYLIKAIIAGDIDRNGSTRHL